MKFTPVDFLSFLTVLVNLGIFASLVSTLLWLFLKPARKLLKIPFTFITANAVLIITLVAFVSVAGSLFFSDILGYAPCRLCWYQRIFLYPQLFLGLVSIYKGDKKIIDYLLMLSVIGALVSLYQVYLQYGGTNIITPCGLGSDVSCTAQYFSRFGYVTIPVMALSAFLTNLIVILIAKITPSS